MDAVQATTSTQNGLTTIIPWIFTLSPLIYSFFILWGITHFLNFKKKNVQRVAFTVIMIFLIDFLIKYILNTLYLDPIGSLSIEQIKYISWMLIGIKILISYLMIFKVFNESQAQNAKATVLLFLGNSAAGYILIRVAFTIIMAKAALAMQVVVSSV